MGKASRKIRKQNKKVQKKLLTEGTPPKLKSGVSHLFTYPYWIFVDTTISLPITEISLEDNLVRIYPPFRSGKANFLPMPFINPRNIPSIHPITVLIDPRTKDLAVIPRFDRQPDGTFSLTFYSSNDWGTPPIKFPMDSIRVDVLGDKEDSYLVYDVVEKLLKQLRWRSNQWWIGRSSDVLSGHKRNSFDISEKGEPLSVLQGIVRARTLSDFEKAIDVPIWQSAIADIQNANEAPLYDVLLLDARYFAAANDIRRSLLDSATACELAKNMTFERLNLPKDGTDLIKHISEKLEEKINRSYKTEEPDNFKIIKDLWVARGNIAHGKIEYRYEGQPVVIDKERCFKFAEAAENCVRWLEKL